MKREIHAAAIMVLLGCLSLFARGVAAAEESAFDFAYAYPEEMLIGRMGEWTYEGPDALLPMARKRSLAVSEILAANGLMDVSLIQPGDVIKIPAEWLLPDPLDEGIVINLAEKRLYYFYLTTDKKGRVASFPIGIGRTDDPTPTGLYQATDKIENPAWYPPLLSRRKNPALPSVVEPGPTNPLGRFWLQLSLPGYGIHGTNAPASIGNGVSLGCIRLYPEHIDWLFKKVSIGTLVEIIDEPLKSGFQGGEFYVEVHRSEQDPDAIYNRFIDTLQIRDAGFEMTLDFDLLHLAIEENRGIPVRISK